MIDATFPDGTYTAVVDRVEGDRAVLVVEDDGETVGEHVVRVADLPAAARRANAVLTVTVETGATTDVSVDETATRRRLRRARRRFDRLSRRPDDPDQGDDG